jgi:hypothetical protein
LREVICPVLELREEKRTFMKVGGGKVDFFPRKDNKAKAHSSKSIAFSHIHRARKPT